MFPQKPDMVLGKPDMPLARICKLHARPTCACNTEAGSPGGAQANTVGRGIRHETPQPAHGLKCTPVSR